MLKDLRHAARMLLHAKGWTAVVILSLALGIGANTAIFSGVNALLLTEIPVEDPGSLVRLRWGGRNDMVTSSSDYGFSNKGKDGQNVRTTFSYPMYQQFLADNKTMSELMAFAPFGRVSAVIDGQAEIATSFVSSGNYYQALGVTARIGRTILPEDDKPTAPPVMVISSKYWHTRFMTDPAVVGKTVRVSNVAVTIVGVLPPDFTGVQQPVGEAPDIGLPLALVPQVDTFNAKEPRLAQPTYWWLQVMGRLKPGATAQQVQGNLEGVFKNTARTGLDSYLKGLTDAARAESRNRNRTEIPYLLVDSARHGVYDVGSTDLRSRNNPQRRGRAGAADRLRQRRQPAALACDHPAEGDLRSTLARRDARPARSAAAHREPHARLRRRRTRHRHWLLGETTAAAAGQSVGDSRLARARIRAGDHHRHRHRLRHRPGTARHGRQPQRRDEAERPQRGRLAQRLEQIAARRSGGNFPGAAGRLRDCSCER